MVVPSHSLYWMGIGYRMEYGDHCNVENGLQRQAGYWTIILPTASPSRAVKYAASIGDVHDPCGTPVLTSLSSSCLLSRHIAALWLSRKDLVHFTIGTGMWNLCSVSSRWEWGIMLKKPVMLNVSMDTAWSWFQATSMLCVTVITASCADLLLIPLYWVEGKSLYLAV